LKKTGIRILLLILMLTCSDRDGYSYGSYLDSKIEEYQPEMERTTGENINMLNMVYNRRSDYFFIAPEEAENPIELSEYDQSDFKLIQFSDIPDGEKRYIIFSKQVDDEIIRRINVYLREYNGRNSQ